MAKRISKKILSMTPQQRRDLFENSQLDRSQADPETIAVFDELLERAEEKANQQPQPVVIDDRLNVLSR